MQVNRRLYRCRHDKRVAGVASGVAEYFEVDPSVVRVVWFLSIFLGGMGLLLYIAMALIVPLEPELGFAPGGAPVGDPTGAAATGTASDVPAGPAATPSPSSWHAMPSEHRHKSRGTGRATTWFGIILVLFGALALVDVLLPGWADSGRFLWPAFIVGIGAILVAAGVRREPTAS
jgi:phage shock protein C